MNIHKTTNKKKRAKIQNYQGKKNLKHAQNLKDNLECI
jgi:hypothetical protein